MYYKHMLIFLVKLLHKMYKGSSTVLDVVASNYNDLLLCDYD